MKKLTLVFISFFIFTNHSHLCAMQNDDTENYKKGITRASFVTAAVGAGTWLGENWAVDLTTKVVKKSINSGPPLFNWTIGSAVRGRTLIEAIPVASKRGALLGAIGAAFLAPLIWDCGESVGNSCEKIYEGKGTTTDYAATGATGLGALLLLYSLFG